MRRIYRSDPRFIFFEPFFESGHGQIIGLASRNGDLRDGLAVTQAARLFDLFGFENIVVEPSRPFIRPEANVILVGSATLFLNPGAFEISPPRPEPVGKDKLEKRLRAIYRDCCFRFIGKSRRGVINLATRKRYTPQRSGLDVDYGLIRRYFRSPTECTVCLEGVHRQGTLAAAKVVTDTDALGTVWKAVRKIRDFDPSVPLEILVKATFRPTRDESVRTLENIEPEPLAVVYNRRWFYDLVEGREWIDQLPWDVHLELRGRGAPRAVRRGEDAAPVPRVELQADLSELDPPDRALCRTLLPGEAIADGREAAKRAEQADRLVRTLTSRHELFDVRLVETPSWAARPRTTPLPTAHTAIRRNRKQFVVHLILGRLFGVPVRHDEETILNVYTEFEADLPIGERVRKFVGSVRGKLRDGFKPLLGAAGNSPGYVQIDPRKGTRTYELRLLRAALVVRLRL